MHTSEYILITFIYSLFPKYSVKRKIIRQGHNTLTITLPGEWAKRKNLKSGDEVELIERDNGLFIGHEQKGARKVATVDMRGIDIPTIWKYFMAVYREGYSEVHVTFDPNMHYDHPYRFVSAHMVDIKYGKKPVQYSPIEAINIMMNRFIGFAVIETYHDSCIIRDMGEISNKEFDSSFRRVFQLIQQMAEEVHRAIETNDASLITHAHDIDSTVDKFHDYCIRVMNLTSSYDVKKSHLIFSTLYLLELTGDEFKRIARHVVEDMQDKSLKNLLPLSYLVLEQYRLFFDFYYQFDRAKIVAISNKDYEIHFYMPLLYAKKPHKRHELSWQELETLNHFRRIGHYINAIIELRVEMEY